MFSTTTHNLFNTAAETVVDVSLLRHNPDSVMSSALSNHSLLVANLIEQANIKGWRIISVDTRWFNILDMLQNPCGTVARIRTVVTAASEKELEKSS